MTIRIWIADDHTIFREGLKQILLDQDDFALVGEAVTGEDLLRRLPATPCDVILLDLSMPGRSGVGLVREICLHPGSHRVVVLSMHEEQQYVIEALKAGAFGYVTKSSASDQLYQTIRKAAAGERVVSPAASEALLRQWLEPAPAHTKLTPRERQIFEMLVAGRKVSNIANALKLSIKTVSSHKANVLIKLDAETTADLVRYALAHGLT